MDYIDLAFLTREISLKLGDERGAKCGYDLLLGLSKGDVEQRKQAWLRYLKEVANGQPHSDEIRDGVWVPAIQLK